MCPLTGFVLPLRVLEHYTTISKVDPRKRNGDHHIKMASGQKRRRRSSSITESKEKLVTTVKKTLLAIMTGPERKGIYTSAEQRFFRTVKSRFKANFSGSGKIPYLEGLAIIFDVKKTFGRSLNPPATMDDTTAQRISTAIAAYFVKIRSLNGDINDTVNSVEIFTACIVTKLATGLTLKGVTLIPKIMFFAYHTPEEVRIPADSHSPVGCAARCPISVHDWYQFTRCPLDRFSSRRFRAFDVGL